MSDEQEVIHGYVLTEPMSNKNAGFSRWGYATKGGQAYFIKEFLDPVFPTDESPYSDEQKAAIRKFCHQYEQRKTLLYSKVNEVSDGNLLRVEEFFRSGSKYYITTRRVNPGDLRWHDLHKNYRQQDLLQLCCTICHALAQLHSRGIIHGDIKPNNILLERTIQGGVAARVTDIDCSFFENEDLDEDLGGDMPYFAPERAQLDTEDGVPAGALSCKVDVFSTGLLIHEMLTGELPQVEVKYQYAFEAAIDDRPIVLSKQIAPAIREVLRMMLQKEPEDRCTMMAAFRALQRILLDRSMEGFVPDSDGVKEVGGLKINF